MATVKTSVVAAIIPALITPVVATTVIARRGWRREPAVLDPRADRHIGHRLVLRRVSVLRLILAILLAVVMVVTGTADHSGQYRADCRPGNDWHYHVALVSGGGTRSNQATGQYQDLGQLRKHGVSSGVMCGFAMEL